jgi:hypothetical protein
MATDIKRIEEFFTQHHYCEGQSYPFNSDRMPVFTIAANNTIKSSGAEYIGYETEGTKLVININTPESGSCKLKLEPNPQTGYIPSGSIVWEYNV